MIKGTIAPLLIGVCFTVSAQQTIVLPAVSDNVQGINGSIWATEVQIIKMDPADHLTIRRLWVCVEGGGFADEPGNAPSWEMWPSGETNRMRQLRGADLLEGTGAVLGAVALKIEGGEVIVNARVADVSKGIDWERTPFGQGQLIPTKDESLVGSAHIPWLGGCLNSPCDVVPGANWNYYRNNIGFVNPNPVPLVLDGVALALGGWPGELVATSMSDPPGERDTFSRVVPPYGWIQFTWRSDGVYSHLNLWGGYEPASPIAGFLISLTPGANLPYFAYASVVFAPDPDSDVPPFNDPLFIPARPGFVAPFDWE